MISLRVLMVEDSDKDAALILRELEKAGYAPTWTRVQTADEMSKALDEKEWDVVLCDYVLPGFGGLAALDLLHRKGLDMPFIVVSGQIGEDVAVQAMKAGAHDYIMKGNLKRLGPAIKRELADAENRRQRRKAEALLRESELELRHLANRLLQLQEEERRSVARELHDEMGQQLTVLKLLLEKAIRLPPTEARAAINEALKVVTELVGSMRGLSLRLRPGMLDDLGLLATLQWYFQDFARRTSVRVDFRHVGMDTPLPPAVTTSAYRIIQEALTNVVRHAGTDHAAVTIEVDSEMLCLRITDDGAGFDPEAVSMSSGIRGIRERARSLGGKCILQSAPGRGTRLMAELPLEEPAA